MDNDKEAFIDMAKAAIERAQQETDQLPLSVPSPLRDGFFNLIMQNLMGKETHSTEHCQQCLSIAHNMAVSAIGWEDRNAARPPTAKERMDALTEQMTIALQFLDKLDKEGLGLKEMT